jgi:hypothetical protein
MLEDNIEKLKKAGLLEEPVSSEVREKLNKLDAAEVDALISIKKKLGGELLYRVKPNIF